MRPLNIFILFCILLFHVIDAQFASHLDTMPMAHNSQPEPVIHHTELSYSNTGLNITGHLMVVTNPMKFFSIFPPMQGCPSFSHTSDNAKKHKCVLATNGGFFNTHTGGCIGNLVSQGEILSTGDNAKANFGSVDGEFVTGYINKTTLKAKKFDYLIAGAGWLVRKGRLFLNESLSIESLGLQFAKFHAPRLAIGYNSAGHLMLVAINGLESIDAGVSLWELASVAMQFGAVSAINLDGGGSVTMVYHNQILNTCSDKCANGPSDPYSCPASPGRCERAVTSITCIAREKA